jgi:AAA domain
LRWLSPGRLAASKITYLDGDPGIRKSTLLCELEARISRGDPLPGGETTPPWPVLLISAEGDFYDTVRPRIDVAGGDARRVITFSTLHLAGVPVAIPDDARILEGIISRADVALLVIDPLVAFLSPGDNVNSDQAVRQAFHSFPGGAPRSLRTEA